MRRNQVIKAICLPEEKQALADMAKQDRQKMAEVLRGLLRKEAKLRGLWPIAKDGDAEPGGKR